DKGVEPRLENLPTLKMSTTKLIAEYPQPKQVAKKEGVSVRELRQEMARERRESEAASASEGGSMKDDPASGNPAMSGAAGASKLSVDPNAVPRAIADDSKRPARIVEELAMAKVTRAIYSERQLQQVMDDFWFNHFNVFAQKGEVKWYLTSYERD